MSIIDDILSMRLVGIHEKERKMSIIDDLKNNEKPFGLMSKEMQEKAKEIDALQFDIYQTDWYRSQISEFCGDFAYRLKPNYQEPDKQESPQKTLVRENLKTLEIRSKTLLEAEQSLLANRKIINDEIRELRYKLERSF